MAPATSLYHEFLYESAKRVKEGDADVHVEGAPVCYHCSQTADKLLQCSGCRGIRYCSPACAKEAWKPHAVPGVPGFQPGHKTECAEMKECMKEGPEFKAILEQFPWGRCKCRGKFHLDLALALRDLYGKGPKYGWWVAETTDVEASSILYTAADWGKMLLSTKHFDEAAGWKLPADEIPWLNFQNRKMPSFPTTFHHNWTSYYEWRGLPLESPAALLLHWPLSIYRLLYLLKLVPDGPVMSERQKLLIYYVGAEKELDSLPVFGELALLLPNTDIEIVMFGPSLYDIVKKAKSRSLASREFVYEYRAPDECGSGSVRIRLHKKSALWDPVEDFSRVPMPDVIIGLDSGISSYPSWHNIVGVSRALSIPFGVTEFGRPSLDLDKTKIPMILFMLSQDDKFKAVVGVDKVDAMLKTLAVKPSNEINPFMCPAPPLARHCNIPANMNGLTSTITARPPIK
ncbi:hypothetical protein BD410DRAFT_524864 [Rickenella mellea]|uniref:MYND-type domain-containing protein n=1 Tax=Rickenella mellea TaxID=50990 RepID=A0A4Y7QI32_9AGAM|nr:hypothetical protein BD410DRAFT_524864 [Rickenella mellea]